MEVVMRSTKFFSCQKCPAPSISKKWNCELGFCWRLSAHFLSFFCDVKVSLSPYTAHDGCETNSSSGVHASTALAEVEPDFLLTANERLENMVMNKVTGGSRGETSR